MKYRIKSKQRWGIGRIMAFGSSSEDYGSSKYYIQAKYKYLPFWITITSSFDNLSQAEENIKLKLKEYSNDNN